MSGVCSDTELEIDKARHLRQLRIYRRRGWFKDLDERFSISRALSFGEFEEAYKLVHDIFVKEKYITPLNPGFRVRTYEALPEMATFIAKDKDIGGVKRVIGVQGIVLESEFGLPSNCAFREEIDGLRNQGKKLCEATDEAVHENYRNNGIPSELMRCCFAYARQEGCNGIITAISPGHMKTYNETMLFEQLGDVKDYSPGIKDEVVLAYLNLDNLQERYESQFGVLNGPSPDNVGVWEWFSKNKYESVLLDAWKAEHKRFYSNQAGIEKFFLDNCGLRKRCSPGELEILHKKWRAYSDKEI